MTSTVPAHMFHSSKNDSIVQPRSMVDEFSDFQSASSTANPVSSRSFGLTFDSPLHVHNMPNKSFVPPSTIGNGFNNGPSNRKESIVGSRLANYDLGTMSPRINQPQPTALSVTSSCTFPASTNGDNLLIGEEDKYSALRGLIDEIPAVTQQQQQGAINSTQIPNYVSHIDGNVEHKISLVNDDMLEVVKTETMDRSLDFGEFQSFSTSENNTYTYPSAAVNNNHVNNFDKGVRQQNDLFDINFSIISDNAKNCTNVGWLTNKPNSTTITHVEQNSSSNDADFGDFVSFSSGVDSIVPSSPKITLKSELCKKSSSSASTSKSKNPSQGVAKISLSRIAKASKFLIESSTYPKPCTTTTNTSEIDISSFDDQQFSYCHQPNANHIMESSSSSFDLMTSEGFDFSLPSPTATGGSVHVDNKVEFGARLKTTVIRSSSASDDDDFGDFTTVHQVPMVDATIKDNGLDLLPFTKSKLKCPVGETQSLASLDLGNYLESGDGKGCIDNDASPDSSEALEFEPYMKEELGITGRNSDLMHSEIQIQTDFEFQVGFPPQDHSSSNFNSEDKYKCFKEEIENERERYDTEWRTVFREIFDYWSRCLTSCLNLITYGQRILTSVSSSEVIREIILHEKGYAYIQNLIEIYLVASRIYLSWKKRSGTSSSWNNLDEAMKIKQIYDEITAAWESLTPFFIGTPLMENISKVDNWKEADYSDCSKVCGVCLSSSTDQNTESWLDYEGKDYHTNCANLYINEVDSILPALYISML